MNNEELKEAAKRIKESEFFVGNTDLNKKLEKQMLFLTLAGMKPVCQIVSSHWKARDGGHTAEADDPNEVKKFLDSFGVFSNISVDGNFTNVTVSMDNSALQEYLHKSELGAPEVYDVGLLYGIPETAVEAFKKGECLGFAEQQELLETDYSAIEPLVQFRLSKDHWKEELEIVKKWYEVLTEYNMIYF